MSQVIAPQLDDADEARLRTLVDLHRRLREDGSLHLAVYYAPDREPQDLFLFEIIGGFGGGFVDPDREIMEVSVSSTTKFEMPAGRQLHLLLTSEAEIRAAIAGRWPKVEELRQLLLSPNRAKVLYADQVGEAILTELRR